MSRRRRRSKPDTDGGFGTSLGDILMTALGCVLLLFMFAVTQIKQSLQEEREDHGRTRAELLAQQRDRLKAERAHEQQEGQLAAASEALLRESAARADADASKRAARARLEALESALKGAQGEVAQLQGVVRAAAAELDPRTARPVDVMLVIDGTSSMKASLTATRRNLAGAIAALRVVSPTARVGLVVFRDKREPESLRLEAHPLTGDVKALAGFLAGIKATSTRRDDDLPEWLCGGLARGIQARWRPDAIRLVIVASDAASHDPQAELCLAEARKFVAEGGQVHVLSTRPRGLRTQAFVRRNYQRQVLPQHQAIAEAGAGVHVRGANSDALLVALLQAAFRSRTEGPAEALRRAAEAAGPAP